MNLILISLILLLGFSSYFFGRKKALVIQSSQRLTALPKFYGYYLSIWCAVPALIIFALWSVFEPSIVKSLILSDYDGQILTKNELQLTYTKIKALALGNYSGNITNFLDNSANKYLQIKGIADNAKIVIILSILIFSLSYAYKSIQNNNRKINQKNSFWRLSGSSASGTNFPIFLVMLAVFWPI